MLRNIIDFIFFDRVAFERKRRNYLIFIINIRDKLMIFHQTLLTSPHKMLIQRYIYIFFFLFHTKRVRSTGTQKTTGFKNLSAILHLYINTHTHTNKVLLSRNCKKAGWLSQILYLIIMYKIMFKFQFWNRERRILENIYEGYSILLVLYIGY